MLPALGVVNCASSWFCCSMRFVYAIIEWYLETGFFCIVGSIVHGSMQRCFSFRRNPCMSLSVTTVAATLWRKCGNHCGYCSCLKGALLLPSFRRQVVDGLVNVLQSVVREPLELLGGGGVRVTSTKLPPMKLHVGTWWW